jgi:hypothetical protein
MAFFQAASYAPPSHLSPKPHQAVSTLETGHYSVPGANEAFSLSLSLSLSLSFPIPAASPTVSFLLWVDSHRAGF